MRVTTRILLAVCTAGVVVAAAVNPAVAAPPGFQLTPVQRVPFPDREYLVDLRAQAAITPQALEVSENGVRVGDVSVTPLSSSGISFGVILAVDASDSMAGRPFADALAAARSFVARRAPNERIGIVTFNTRSTVLQAPTASAQALRAALTNPPRLAYGTRIFDGITQSLRLLHGAKTSAGAIVVLSDGADVGSSATLADVVAKARHAHVRVFTVGLRSAAFDPQTLAKIADSTGGSYAEAASPAQLAPIYGALGERFARQYVVQYRSAAAPKSSVSVNITIARLGSAQTGYRAPTPSGLAPFHRSPATSFLLSPWSLILLALVIAVLLGYVLSKLLARPRSGVVERVSNFVVPNAPPRPTLNWRTQGRQAAAVSSRRAQGMLARLQGNLEIAEIETSAQAFVGLTFLATIMAMIVLAVISPILALLGLLTPLVSRAYLRSKLKKVRNQFGDQLPTNLQVLASALRAGHSFVGALGSVVNQAHEPSKRELRRAINDEQLGVPMDEALRRVAVRMKSRDLEQVALVAELQRTTGGNVAEVLDVVVGTIRERQDVRRLIKTLTAQGRMARWILTGLPIVTALGFYVVQPEIAGPFYSKPVGQVVLLLAAIGVVVGSLVIQKIVDVEV